MAITINGVITQELVASHGEAFDFSSGPSMRKGFLCEWADRFKVAQGLLGLSNTTSIGGAITLNTPAQYPEFNTAYAQSIEIVPKGAPTQGTKQIQYPYCAVWASYQSVPWSFSGTDFNQIDPAHPYIYAEQNIRFSTEWITIPGSQVFYGGGLGKALAQDFAFASPRADLSIKIHRIPYLPAQQILNALQAPLNSTTYLGCAPGFLLFNGADNHQTRMSDGTFTQDVSYSFSFRPLAPWDYVFHGPSGTWKQVVNSSGGSIIPRSDLSGIIPTYYVG